MSNTRETFGLTFRGAAVRWHGSPAKHTWTSVYPEQYVVLTYPIVNGQPAFTPQIVATYATHATARKEIRDRASLRSFRGQSFIIRALPGTTEIVDATVMSNTKAEVA